MGQMDPFGCKLLQHQRFSSTDPREDGHQLMHARHRQRIQLPAHRVLGIWLRPISLPARGRSPPQMSAWGAGRKQPSHPAPSSLLPCQPAPSSPPHLLHPCKRGQLVPGNLLQEAVAGLQEASNSICSSQRVPLHAPRDEIDEWGGGEGVLSPTQPHYRESHGC